jgi:hypothetical protein
MAAGLIFVLRRYFDGIVSCPAMPYRAATECQMTLLNKVFTTRTLIQIIVVLVVVVAMKATSLHYDFSWATALAN